MNALALSSENDPTLILIMSLILAIQFICFNKFSRQMEPPTINLSFTLSGMVRRILRNQPRNTFVSEVLFFRSLSIISLIISGNSSRINSNFFSFSVINFINCLPRVFQSTFLDSLNFIRIALISISSILSPTALKNEDIPDSTLFQIFSFFRIPSISSRINSSGDVTCSISKYNEIKPFFGSSLN